MCGVVVLAIFAAGCNGNRLRDERNALYLQNQELQDHLNQTRAALDSTESEHNRLISEMARLQQQQGGVYAPGPFAPGGAAGNAFAGIPGIETTFDAQQITVRVPGDVLFAPGKVDLKDSSRKTLDRIAAIIKKDYPGNTIRVIGYTDTDPIRKSQWTDNLNLSLERAAAVHRYLQKQGVNPKQMEAIGRGQWHPRETKASSRRVEIVVLR